MNRKEFEKKQANEPLKLETMLLAKRLGGVKHQIDALKLIEKTFEAELGATATNWRIVEIMPEGKKPPLTEFHNTTDKSVLYPRLVQYCLENAQELPTGKREKACSHLEAFMEVFTKQTENAPEPTETPPEPQRWESKIEGSSRALGRKRIPVKDLILLNDKDKVFTKLKENLKGKSKDAAMEILINNIKNGTLMKPSWNAFCDAFPMVEIKEGTYYYKLRKAGI